MTSPPAHTANWQPIANLYESLNTLWNLMSAFVDLGFGTEHACRAIPHSDRAAAN